MTPTRTTVLREGKSKILYETTAANRVIQFFKNDATAFNALKKGQIKDKGKINNAVSCAVFQFLAKRGISSHFVSQPTAEEMLVQKVTIIPVEVVVRNKAAGSLCKRLGIEKGKPLDPPLVEYFLKDDGLGDPLISEGHILYFHWATADQLTQMNAIALKVNHLLRPVFREIGLELIDFKLEFGLNEEKKLLLADEFTADGCRLWDLKTGESMDKDRFRHDMGKVDEAYADVGLRLTRYLEANP